MGVFKLYLNQWRIMFANFSVDFHDFCADISVHTFDNNLENRLTPILLITTIAVFNPFY